MKRTVFSLLAAFALCVSAAAAGPAVSCPSALLMEKQTGTVLFAQDEHTPREPASVTKIMTLLLVMEAIDSGALSYDDVVTGSAHAAGMGGSQIWLKENEQMTVRDLLKAVCIVSGNDAAVALAEHLAGSEDAFVERMNARAQELGMNDTHFVNCTGLPAAGHLTSACDIALMSRELILHHPDIRQFTTVWMDSLRGGESMLVNTNKLIRFYDGATGLKTGSTGSAGYCLSATAEKNGMELIAVVLKGKTSDERFSDAKSLLNYGFLDGGFYLSSGILPSCRFFCRTNLSNWEELEQPVRQMVAENAFDFIVTREEGALYEMEGYELVCTEYQEYDGVLQPYSLFRAKG